MRIEYMGFVLEQDVKEPGAWVYRDGKLVMHVLLDHPLSEEQLKEDMTEVFQTAFDNVPGFKPSPSQPSPF